MAQADVLLVACGSFNPPTIMHLRMFGKVLLSPICLCDPMLKKFYLMNIDFNTFFG